MTALPLGGLLEKLIDHQGRTPKKLGGDFSVTGIPVISANNVKGGRLDLGESLRYVSPEMYNRWMPEKLKPGDVLLTSEAPLGELAYLGDRAEFCLGQRLFALRANANLLDSRFLYYVLSSTTGQRGLHARATGTTAQGIRQSELVKVEVELPPLPEQRAIAHILGTLDDKIELNRQMNQTLEQIAAALFRSWFIDFDPVRAKMAGREPEGMDAATAALFPERLVESEVGEIPEGWEIASLGRLFPGDKDCVITGPFGSTLHAHDYREEGVPLILVKHVVDGKVLDNGLPLVGEHKLGELSRFRLLEGDIVFTRVGAVGRSAYVHPHNAGWLISGQMLRVRISDFQRLHPRYLSQLFLRDEFVNMVENHALGTTRPSLNTGLLRDFQFVAPSGDLTQLFAEKVAAMDGLVQVHRSEVRTLSQLRDALLPRLLSGDLRVPAEGRAAGA